MRHDILSDALFVLNSAENIGKRSCDVPASNLVKNILSVIGAHIRAPVVVIINRPSCGIPEPAPTDGQPVSLFF